MDSQIVESGRVFLNELSIDPALLDQDLQHAGEKRDVAACRNREPIVRQVRPENGAAERGRHPIALHARLAVGIDEDDFRAEFFRLVQVFGCHRLIVGGIGAEENHQIGAVPVFIAASGSCDTDRMFHGGGAGRVAKPRGVVHVVRSQEPGDFLGHIIDLVRHAARGKKERQALRRAGANLHRDTLISLVP